MTGKKELVKKEDVGTQPAGSGNCLQYISESETGTESEIPNAAIWKSQNSKKQ